MCSQCTASAENISIHALREEGDQAVPDCPVHHRAISIHALREEGDPAQGILLFYRVNFYPRPPRGGRPIKMPRHHLTHDISIHALREEGDWARQSLFIC